MVATDRDPRVIAANYDDYYVGVAQTCLRYALPLSAALYLGFFLWDCLHVRSFRLGVTTFLLRFSFAAILLGFWVFVPRMRSVRSLQLGVSVLYVLGMLNIILILVLIPNGLIYGSPGLVLVAMFAAGTFCPRPLTVAISGSIGVTVLAIASLYVGLSYRDTTSGVLQHACAVLGAWAFLVLLDRELRYKHRTELSLEHEKQQNETLLREILPRYVIQRIREGADHIAESISEVNIIFIDIVGFTAIAKKVAPKHLVELLGEVFGSFDEKCERYGVTKIKTIGDAYMAVTGAPEPSELSAVAAVEFSMYVVNSVDRIARRTGLPLRVRVGIATGGVISGMLSLKRPAYDLWGDTVNLAARMESTSEPGRVQIAETTFWRVRDKFTCEPRGLVEVKGFGTIQTYFINLPMPEVATGRQAVQS